jgi:hypothetical protein
MLSDSSKLKITAKPYYAPLCFKYFKVFLYAAVDASRVSLSDAIIRVQQPQKAAHRMHFHLPFREECAVL